MLAFYSKLQLFGGKAMLKRLLSLTCSVIGVKEIGTYLIKCILIEKIA